MNFQNAQFKAAYGTFKQLPPSEKPEIAFSGRSNVGKSSLINRLFGRRNLARVSATPGKTATINFYELEDVHFVDLPGYGYAKVSKADKARWNDLIGGYLCDGNRDIALIFQLIDMRHPPTKDDLMMIDFLIESELPFAVVLTKADKLSRTERQKRLDALKVELPYYDDLSITVFSSVTDEGVSELRDIIEDVIGDQTQPT